MQQLLSDLGTEQEELDDFLQPLPESCWRRRTRWSQRTVASLIAHLAGDEEAVAAGKERCTQTPPTTQLPPVLLARWREARRSCLQSLAQASPTDRLVWNGRSLTVRRLVASRIAEYWAHSVDIRESFGVEVAETPRLRHVARLAWEVLPELFWRAGEPFLPIRAELSGPSGPWVLGPEDTDQLLWGEASEWCRVAVGLLPRSEAPSLHAEGRIAERALYLLKLEVCSLGV